MKKIALLLIIGILCLCGCRVQTQEPQGNPSVQEEVESEEIIEVVEETPKVETSEVTETEVAVFSQLPEMFFFSSGSGGWETELYVQADGSFYGQFHDSEMGSVGEGYPNGTRYICSFEGKFTTPTKVSEYVYSTSIESINYEEPNQEYIEEEIKYITSTPYGLDNAGEILIYLYGTPREEIAEGFISWMPGCEMTTDCLDYYGIYNVKEETAFLGMKE